MSLRAYAVRRGVSAESVSKAVRTGRLVASVTVIAGAPKIADPDLADREWEANTQPRIDQPQPSQQRPAPRAKVARVADPDDGEDEDDDELPADVPPYKLSRARREAEAARREAALADLAEIDVAERREELVPADEARAFIFERFAVVKGKLLGVPSRVVQQLPHLAKEVEPVIDGLIREVLEELAADVETDGDAEEDP